MLHGNTVDHHDKEFREVDFPKPVSSSFTEAMNFVKYLFMPKS